MAHEVARDGIQCRLLDLSKRRKALRCSGPALAAPRPAKPIARKPAVSSPRSTTGSPKASAHKTLKRQRRCSTNSADFMRGAGMAGGSSEARGGANTGAVQAPPCFVNEPIRQAVEMAQARCTHNVHYATNLKLSSGSGTQDVEGTDDDSAAAACRYCGSFSPQIFERVRIRPAETATVTATL